MCAAEEQDRRLERQRYRGNPVNSRELSVDLPHYETTNKHRLTVTDILSGDDAMVTIAVYCVGLVLDVGGLWKEDGGYLIWWKKRYGMRIEERNHMIHSNTRRSVSSLPSFSSPQV